MCECDYDSYGLQCEFQTPCDVLQMDSRFAGFQGTRPWSDEYRILQDASGDIVNVYDRPVYISKSEAGFQAFDLMFFTGRVSVPCAL